MVIIILAVLIALLIMCVKEAEADDGDDLLVYVAAFLTAAILVMFVTTGALVITVQSATLIDSKIALYAQTNQDIESNVTATVKNYMQYEQDTYKGMVPQEAMAFAQSYPALASNSLVQEQITTYKENRKKIVRLEEDKINAKIARWWLYFGN